MPSRALALLLAFALTTQSVLPAAAFVRAALPVKAPAVRVTPVPGGLSQASLTGSLNAAINVSLDGSIASLTAIPSVVVNAVRSLKAVTPAAASRSVAATPLAAPVTQKIKKRRTEGVLPSLKSTAQDMQKISRPGVSASVGYDAGNKTYHNGIARRGAVSAVSNVGTSDRAITRENAASEFRRKGASRIGSVGLKRPDSSSPDVNPTFAPPRADASLPLEELEETEVRDQNEGLKLSFPPATKNQVTAGNPKKAISGVMKRVRPNKGSKKYWADYRRGAEITIMISGENIFTTKITRAANIKIKDLQRKDFQTMMPDYKLTAGVRELRGALMDSLESKRRMWQPSDAPIDKDTVVRVIEFRSYKEVYQDKHGKDAEITTPAPTERTPLVIQPTGKLARLAYLIPRAIFIDLDMFAGAVDKDILYDIAKLQRSGAYFVGLSRKPYEAAEGLRDNLIRQMSDYALGTLFTYRFLAVTDDGAVISSFPKDGNMKPVSVAEITPNEIAVLTDAVQRASAEAGISRRSIRRVEQPSIYTNQDSESKFARKRWGAPDTQVRFEVEFTKAVKPAERKAWRAAFDKLLEAHGLKLFAKEYAAENGRPRLSLQKTDLAGSMDRLQKALQDSFDLYLNPGDYLVLSNDEKVLAANPGVLDVAGLTGLKGEELVENALGLILGEYRQDLDIDRIGSASRMISFTKYRERYMADMVVDEQRSEQNINFFSGHVIHSANDWLIWHLRNGRRPTPEEYEAHLRKLWAKGLTGSKPVGLPDTDKMDGWLNASAKRGVKMYELILKIQDRGEIIMGSEIPRQLIVKDYSRKKGHEGEVKGRYITNAIIDLLVYRPNPEKPGHGTIVAYDYKSGPAKSKEKLEEDPQVLIYSLLAQENWVGKTFSVPYLNGDEGDVIIDDFSIEFIYSPIKQTPSINRWMLEEIRLKMIRVYERMYKAAAELMGELPPVKRTRKLEGNPPRRLPSNVSGLRMTGEDAAKILSGRAKSVVFKRAAQPKAYVAILDTTVGNTVIGFARISRVQPLKDGSFRWHFTNVTPIKTPYAVDQRGGGSWVKDVPVHGAKLLKPQPKKKKAQKKSTGS